MRKQRVAAAILELLPFGSAHEYEFFRWNTPGANLATGNVYRRQAPPPGYHPEFGSCGSGTTCENACGPNWVSCQASTDLSLFCYNKVDLNQTCCGNGSGRACDSGYYCAWQEFGGRVWCCENGQSLEECGLPLSSSSSVTGSPTTSDSPSVSTSSTPGSPTSRSTGKTTTDSDASSTATPECPASTVITSWATTTVISTISFAVSTTTVTVQSGECSSSASSSHGGPPSRTSESRTITEPPSPSSTSHKPPIHNTTSTRTLATAGAGTLAKSRMGTVLLLLPLLLL